MTPDELDRWSAEKVKLCECGCGNPSPIATRNRKSVGHFKGEPIRFINGHNGGWNKKGYYQPLSQKGNITIRIPDDDPYYAMAGEHGYILEHRYILAKHLGRCLENDEVVHHKNGNVRDNHIDNLELYESHAKHMSHHMTTEEARWRGIKGNQIRYNKAAWQALEDK